MTTVPFWDRCDQSGGDDACWTWQMGTDSDGRPRFVSSGVVVSARLHAMRLFTGDDTIQRVDQCPSDALCVNPRHLSMPTLTDADQDAVRFAEFVDRGGPDDCWLWTGYAPVLSGGRRQPRFARSVGEPGARTKQKVRAQRFAWEREHGPVESGWRVGNCPESELCVNPAHLELQRYGADRPDP